MLISPTIYCNKHVSLRDIIGISQIVCRSSFVQVYQFKVTRRDRRAARRAWVAECLCTSTKLVANTGEIEYVRSKPFLAFQTHSREGSFPGWLHVKCRHNMGAGRCGTQCSLVRWSRQSWPRARPEFRRKMINHAGKILQ